MIEADVFLKTKRKVTTASVQDYISQFKDRYTSNNIAVAANTFAERVRSSIWGQYNLSISQESLDMLSQCVDSLGPYKNWSDFVEVHGVHIYAEEAADFVDVPINTKDFLEIKLNAMKTLRLITKVDDIYSNLPVSILGRDIEALPINSLPYNHAAATQYQKLVIEKRGGLDRFKINRD